MGAIRQTLLLTEPIVFSLIFNLQSTSHPHSTESLQSYPGLPSNATVVASRRCWSLYRL